MLMTAALVSFPPRMLTAAACRTRSPLLYCDLRHVQQQCAQPETSASDSRRQSMLKSPVTNSPWLIVLACASMKLRFALSPVWP